jgi:hypothetical protein
VTGVFRVFDDRLTGYLVSDFIDIEKNSVVMNLNASHAEVARRYSHFVLFHVI